MFHWLRTHAIGAIMTCEIAGFLLALAFVPAVGDFVPRYPSALGMLTNIEREKAGLEDLRENALLDQAAQAKAEDMASKGYFSHTSPDGLTPWDWLDRSGYEYRYAGENLALDFDDASSVTEAWMHSPGHRANIERAAYTEVGTGVAKGIYKGRMTTFYVQMYAKPIGKGVARI
jgi:uncharacterized protein YkwD